MKCKDCESTDIKITKLICVEDDLELNYYCRNCKTYEHFTLNKSDNFEIVGNCS